MGDVHARWPTSEAHPRERRADEVAKPQPHALLALQHAAGNQAVARMLSGVSRRTIQRELVDHPGPAAAGQWNGPMGLKVLLKDTDDGKLYFKSNRSTATDWVLIEVTISQDGTKYVKAGPEKTVKVPKKAPRSVADWRKVAYLSGATILYPAQRYPHVTIDLAKAPGEESDVVEFTEMHYSRSLDDPYRSGYRLSSAGWEYYKPNDRKDKQKECDDAVDLFLETVGLSQRVIRK